MGIQAEHVRIICRVCGKELSTATNDEECEGSLYWHRRHPIVVIEMREDYAEWLEIPK